MERIRAVAWALLLPLCWWGAAVSHGFAGEGTSTAKEQAEKFRALREESKGWIEVPEIRVDAARDLLGKEGVVFIDVTCKEQSAKIKDQIVGSHWEDCTKVEEWAPRYRNATAIVVYCGCKKKPKSARVVQTLVELGYENAYHLVGGWFAWRDAGYPVEAKGVED